MRASLGQFWKVKLGLVDSSIASLTTGLLNFGTYCNSGLNIFGVPITGVAGAAKAGCIIGPPVGTLPPVSLWVEGAYFYWGFGTFNGATIFNGATLFNGVVTKNGAVFKNAISLKNTIEVTNGPDIDNANINVAGSFSASAGVCPVIAGYCTGNKPFDISHPIKKGKRIRHICAEGPESGIYIRGVLNGGKTIIEIPDYWEGLVDMNSITVNLTPIGTYQELFVQKLEWGKNIIVRNNAGGPINCSYQVWAARHINVDDHDEKLHVVYDGESPKDYPGDNNQFSFSLPPGYHYDEKGGIK